MKEETKEKLREARRLLYGADVDLIAELERLEDSEFREEIVLRRGQVLAAISLLWGMRLE